MRTNGFYGKVEAFGPDDEFAHLFALDFHILIANHTVLACFTFGYFFSVRFKQS